ncbi:MAG: phasin family protein [Planctomycetota bacterium]|jgi:polyhydroxyalkanoate synthesis regulator phasin
MRRSLSSKVLTMNMLELIKQGIFSSIGLASLTQDKVAEIVSEIGKQIPLSEQQAREFTDEINRRSEQARKDFGQQFDSQVDHAIIQMGLVKNEIRKATETASDAVNRVIEDRVRSALERVGAATADEVEALKKRVAILESKVANLS